MQICICRDCRCRQSQRRRRRCWLECDSVCNCLWVVFQLCAKNAFTQIQNNTYIDKKQVYVCIRSFRVPSPTRQMRTTSRPEICNLFSNDNIFRSLRWTCCFGCVHTILYTSMYIHLYVWKFIEFLEELAIVSFGVGVCVCTNIANGDCCYELWCCFRILLQIFMSALHAYEYHTYIPQIY